MFIQNLKKDFLSLKLKRSFKSIKKNKVSNKWSCKLAINLRKNILILSHMPYKIELKVKEIHITI